jgi:hypothetical protein
LHQVLKIFRRKSSLPGPYRRFVLTVRVRGLKLIEGRIIPVVIVTDRACGLLFQRFYATMFNLSQSLAQGGTEVGHWTTWGEKSHFTIRSYWINGHSIIWFVFHFSVYYLPPFLITQDRVVIQFVNYLSGLFQKLQGTVVASQRFVGAQSIY